MTRLGEEPNQFVLPFVPQHELLLRLVVVALLALGVDPASVEGVEHGWQPVHHPDLLPLLSPHQLPESIL